MNTELGNGLKTFTDKTIELLNTVVGALSLLFAVVIILYIVYWVVKRHGKPEIAELANKNIKTAVISIFIGIIVITLGFTLINTVLGKVGDTPFTTAQLLSNLIY